MDFTTEIIPPLTVRFTDASTGNVTAWAWDFGDGQTSTERNPTHTYAAPGDYTVRLEVNELKSHTETVSLAVVEPPPPPPPPPVEDWLPAAGNVKAIRLDATGAPVNFLDTVRPPNGGHTGNGILMAYSGGCIAEDFGPLGALIEHGGGDGDYWGTEVRAFEFAERKWKALSQPHPMVAVDDPGYVAWKATNPPNNHRSIYSSEVLPSNHPMFWEKFLNCEHGPVVDDALVGLLPEGTTPGVPHTYDGLVWVPGTFIGNQRGAMVRPHSQFMYTTRSTGRAHYFDLDALRWGRLSDGRLSQVTSPIKGWDEATGRIYHHFGYLDVVARRHTRKTWTGTTSASGAFDGLRRLWMMPRITALADASSEAPGELRAFVVDSATAYTPVQLTGEIWPTHRGFHGAFFYAPELDRYYLYNPRGGSAATPWQQTIWEITPPGANWLASPWNVRKIVMPGDAVAPTNVGTTYGRVQWSRKLGCVVIYIGPSASGLVYLFRPWA